jgi:hypothetical protein
MLLDILKEFGLDNKDRLGWMVCNNALVSNNALVNNKLVDLVFRTVCP